VESLFKGTAKLTLPIGIFPSGIKNIYSKSNGELHLRLQLVCSREQRCDTLTNDVTHWYYGYGYGYENDYYCNTFSQNKTIGFSLIAEVN